MGHSRSQTATNNSNIAINIIEDSDYGSDKGLIHRRSLKPPLTSTNFHEISVSIEKTSLVFAVRSLTTSAIKIFWRKGLPLLRY